MDTTVVINEKRSISLKKYRQIENVKNAIWLYFFLLLFEGGLRKWVLPGLATPLLIVRDPIALWIIFQTSRMGLFPKRNMYILGVVALTILSFYMSLIFGHGNLMVAVYGVRITLLHFPLIFVIGKLFTLKDVQKGGKRLLWISIPMTLLLAVQFYSPQSAFVNRGVGGNMEGSGFSGAMGFFRASTTFSFTNGTSLFFGFLGAFIFYFWVTPNVKINRLLLITSTSCLLAAIPLSISRGLFFSLGVTLVFAVVIFSNNIKGLVKFLFMMVGTVLIMFIISQLSFIQTATMAFTERFTNANASEGGVEGVFLDRFLGGMIGALFSSTELPFWGHGLGMGTNAGAQMMKGRADFLISEGEWGRILGEMGLILGIFLVFARIYLGVNLLRKSYREVASLNYLPWLLLSFGFLNLLQGQWAQPTSLGFSVIAVGFVIASMDNSSKKKFL
jgi:hypothetical protein